MSLLDQLKQSNPDAFKGYSDEEILGAVHKTVGGDFKDVATQFGYDAPSSMMGKELYAGGNSYLKGMGHIGAAMGIPGAAEYAKRKGERAEALQAMSTAPHSWDEMKFGASQKGFWPYVGQLAAGSAPYAAEAAGYTAADVLTGGALTPAIAARYLGRAGMAAAPEVLGGQALKAGATFAERRAAVEAAREAAPGMARAAMLPVVTYPSALGDTLGNQFEESGTYNLPRAAAAAAPYAALNALGLEGSIARGGLPRLGLKGLEKNALGRAASGVLATGASEAVNETGQEVANQYARMGVNPNAGLFDPAALERYKESAIGGALLGGIPGSLHALPKRAPLDTKKPADLLNPPAPVNRAAPEQLAFPLTAPPSQLGLPGFPAREPTQADIDAFNAANAGASGPPPGPAARAAAPLATAGAAPTGAGTVAAGDPVMAQITALKTQLRDPYVASHLP